MSNPQRSGINTNVKQFNTSNLINSALWIFTKSDSTITPGIKGVNALIQGNLTVEGTLNTPSDLSVKENIEAIPDQLYDAVLDIKPIKFNYTYDDDKKEHYGVIAQELEEVLPELVTDTNPKTVNYSGIIGVLIEAIKEQQVQINELQNQIDNLRNK